MSRMLLCSEKSQRDVRNLNRKHQHLNGDYFMVLLFACVLSPSMWNDKLIIPRKSGLVCFDESNFIILVKPPLLVFRKSYLFVRCPFFVSHVCNFKISGPTKIAKTSLGCYRCYKVFFVPSNLYIRWLISRSWAPGTRSIQPCKYRCVIGA